MNLMAACLVLIVAGYALYLVRLVSIAFVGGRKKETETQCSGKCIRCVLIDDMEDCDYTLFWQAQKPALELLASAEPTGALPSRLEKLYHGLARSYPELFEGSDFGDWVQALQKAEVVSKHTNLITITDKGKFILQTLQRDRVPTPLFQFSGNAEHRMERVK